jgi:Zn-dependent protease with chaperone function
MAQLRPVYSFQKDDTVLRKNYYEQSVAKKKLLLASIGKENAKDYKAVYENQFENIDKLWNSTRPVTSPEAHTYLQSIVQKIIVANPELKGTDARVVFSRDWWPNAVSMGDGTIAINAGLMVYLDNEAELVFVICHELSHYYLEHTQKAIKKYIETINSDAYQAELKKLSKQQYGVNRQVEELAKSIAFGSRKHSRDNEAAADKQAFQFMKKTGYNCSGIISTLELLNRVDDSLLNKPVHVEQVFQFADYPFKKKWVQEESAIFSKLDDNSSFTKNEKDSLKTHPDCNKRIALLIDSVRLLPAAGKEFMVNETLFRQLKKDFFPEITEECFREAELSRNLYYSLILLQSGENKQLAVYSVARCLNLLYEKQKAHKFGTAVDVENKIYPEDYNLLLRMLNRVHLDEIANINVQFCRQYETEMKDYDVFKKEWIKAVQFKSQQ